MTITATNWNIKDTSKLTGLSPSVLRIWELRYGWPNPKRKSNGYRTYQQHQVDELKRVAEIVKNGTPISALIVDGLPKWPSAETAAPAKRALVQARSGTPPVDAVEAGLYHELLNALETHRTPMVRQLLQRIVWTVRPSDEAQTALVPTLVAIAELRSRNRPLPEATDITAQIKERCEQLLRMQRSSSDALVIVPARAGDEALAALTAVVLCYRGVPAKPWHELREPSSACLVVTDGEMLPTKRTHQVGHVSTLGTDGGLTITQLLDRSKPLPWQVTVPTA
ncbi:MAG: MerR family transcriptional regulator [Planctomycetes bacterium]|nr:MerR family transcriptional regulator [Planctomycetota bacterium]